MVTPQLYLVRHGETEWSASGRHTSVTDVALTAEGEDAARGLAPVLAALGVRDVLTSPRIRARRTAELAGFPDARVDDDLVEWFYGDYEGVTTAEIRESVPGWTVWTHPTPGGETPEHISERLDRVVARVRAATEPTLVFAHSHSLRALAARWLDQDVSLGQHLVFDTASLSVLGDDRGTPVIQRWNQASGEPRPSHR